MIKKYNQYITESNEDRSLYQKVEDYFLDYIENTPNDFRFYIKESNKIVICTFCLDFLHKTDMEVKDLDKVINLFKDVLGNIKNKIEIFKEEHKLENSISIDSTTLTCSFYEKKDNLEISDVIVLTEENSIGLRFKELEEYCKGKYNLTLRGKYMYQEPTKREEMVYYLNLTFDEFITDTVVSEIKRDFLNLEYEILDDEPKQSIITNVSGRMNNHSISFTFYPYLHVHFI
jgi:hypothetical protein